MLQPIDYARAACDTMMRRYCAPDLPPERHFHYHQGVFLSGMYETFRLCGEEKYFKYIKDWIDSVFDENGNILKYTHGDLDDIQPGILLFPLWDRTHDPRYLHCLKSVYAQVKDIPRNAEGGFWHKTWAKDQMWLDGLYMVGPFCSEYASRYHLPHLQDTVVRQALMIEEKTRDEHTGLYYHAWDGARETTWANKQTGCSSEFWGRAIGWVPVALLNDLDHLNPDVKHHDDLIRISCDLLKALCRYQSKDGRWYQVVDKGEQPENWLENSCSCLFVAGLCKAMRKGYLPNEYSQYAFNGYEGVIRSISWDGDDIQIGNVCIGTGVGDYKHYCERPVSTNDLHGVGAFLLMCTEMQQWQEICANV